PRSAEAERPTGRLADTYPERAQRRQGGQGTPPPRGRGPAPRNSGSSPGRNSRSVPPSRSGGSSRDSSPRGGAPSRKGPRPTPASRNTTRSGTGTGARRPGPRTTGTGLRPANPRLLRQRLFVFVVVTLVVALGIALVQGCQGPG
ncbi:serine/threonine protein kinase, partial [Streptomyces sp. 13-12-16]